MNEYLLGNLFGFSQVIIGYPFDTLKTNLQNSKPIKPFLQSPRLLYHGIKYPLISTMIGTTFMFGNYSSLLDVTGNKFLSASITGILGSFFITPFDYYKIKNQTLEDTKNILQINKINSNKHNKQFYSEKYLIQSKQLTNSTYSRFTRFSLPQFRGLTLTMFRESIAIPIYFISFETLYYEYKWHPFLAGGVAGLNSWLFTYPLDTLKSRRQLYPYKSLKEITGMGALYKGLGITLMRGFIVNGSSFYFYSKIKNRS
jgi:solute carrier family 25 carnitine/acylcarnitine transporter 20/29